MYLGFNTIGTNNYTVQQKQYKYGLLLPNNKQANDN